MKKFVNLAMSFLVISNQAFLEAFATEYPGSEVPRISALSIPITGSIEIKTANGARVVRGTPRIRRVRHYAAGSKHRVRRYYLVKRNPNQTRIGNTVLTRASKGSHAGPGMALPNSVSALTIKGVQNLLPGHRYIEVEERNGQFVIKESGEVNPNGLFLEVVKEGDEWVIKGTDIRVEYKDTFDVSKIPNAVKKYINPNTDYISPTGNYVEFVNNPQGTTIPLNEETVQETEPPS